MDEGPGRFLSGTRRRLEQLEGIPVRIFDLDSTAPWTHLHLVAERHPGLLRAGDARRRCSCCCARWRLRRVGDGAHRVTQIYNLFASPKRGYRCRKPQSEADIIAEPLVEAQPLGTMSPLPAWAAFPWKAPSQRMARTRLAVVLACVVALTTTTRAQVGGAQGAPTTLTLEQALQ